LKQSRKPKGALTVRVAFDLVTRPRMSPTRASRRFSGQAPASADEAAANHAGLKVVAVAAAATVAACAFSVFNDRSEKRKHATFNSPAGRVVVDVRPQPGGVITFQASAPVGVTASAWPAARAAALGQLSPRTQLTDVLFQDVLERTPVCAVVRQDARWRVGLASGVARVTVRACVDDATETARFELVKHPSDATSEDETSAAVPRLATYRGEVVARRGKISMSGFAAVDANVPSAHGSRFAKTLATRFTARVLRGQIKTSLADLASVAEKAAL
jgi:hypothetical protein